MPALTAERAGAAPAGGTRWRARAFGLEIDASFEAPGLPPASGPASGPRTRLELAPEDEIDRRWPKSGATRVLEEQFEPGEPARTIDAHPRAGYRLYARHFGLARISPNGARVVCAPPELEAWSWQRFLVGRILPWAAVLRGYETFHASAVALDGRAVAFVGPTGAGKTSLAVQLVARGGEFVTDDVLSLEDAGGTLLAHPGASIASMREAERDVIPRDTWSRLGTVLGESGKTYMAVPRVDRPLPLGALYFLERGDGPPIEPIAKLDPRLLLASTFVLSVQTRKRLRNQLDVCAALARGVPLFRLRIAPGVSAEQLAGIVHEHVPREAQRAG
jgi:hypothetical protein